MRTRAGRSVSAVPFAAVLAACAGGLVPAASPAPPVPGLHERLEAVRAAHGMPALVAAVISSRTIEVAATGVRSVDRPEAAGVDDRFGLGSNAKAITATVAASLVESNLLDWDLSLGDALPGVPIDAEVRAATVRTLWRGGEEPAPSAPDADLLAVAVLERAGGLPWRELVRRRVFAPLATGGAFEASGGIAMSIAEYARFVQAHLRGLRGEEGFLGSRTVRELHRPDGGHALGWGVQEFAGARASVRAGGSGESWAFAAIQPSRDRAAALLTNDGRDEAEAWCVALLEDLISRP